MARLVYFLAAYLVALLWAAPRLTFWLDEVLTLTGAVEPTLTALMVNLEKQQGATPLAFLIPRWSIQLFGLSAVAARLPSILASILSCVALFRIAQHWNVRQPLWPVALFALWPLQVRYALEVRPYSVALCLGLWLTLEFLKAGRWWMYALLTVAMGLTHPYALTIPAVHLLWSLAADRKRALPPALGLVFTLLALAPWYAHFQDGWRAISGEQQLGTVNPRAALVFVREITGSGYGGFAVLAAGVSLGARHIPGPRWLLPLWAALPLVAVPVANVLFAYFFAVRQLIYIVPALALMFATRPPYLPGLFLAISFYANMAWLERPREDWSAAADAIHGETERGACVEFVADSQKLFAFFRPELKQHSCGSGATHVVLAGSTYEPQQEAARSALAARGLRKVSERTFEAPIVEVWTR